ncbi:MAG: bile acid:sodium symporter family protein [Sphingosinicella sp.]|uniref:bile acid:sodium symporter family protein n=1 Tax=Sphingosinicella sp. TaxID=1917971 RepID=UPI004037A3B1
MSEQAIAFFQMIVPVGLALIMFSMGLTLQLRDFGLVLRSGRLVSAGLAGQLVALPLLALAIGALFQLPPELALGLFIVAICPAGTTSNALTFVGRGNVALAIVLTALTSLVTVFSIPFLLSWALPWFLAGTREVPSISIPTTMLQLFTITVLPVSLGMIVRHFRPALAERMVPWLRPTAFVVLVAVIGLSVAVAFEMVLRNLAGVGPAIWVLNVMGMAAGLAIGRAIGVGRRDSMTLAIEIGVQNVTLAIFLTLTVLDSLELAVTQNIYGVIMLLNGTILIRLLRRRIAAET